MIYFKPTEFNCPCCNMNFMEQSVLDKIDKIRGQLGVPLHINSGFRCKKHNADPHVGGKPTSQHLVGRAIDVSTMNLTADKRFHLLFLVVAEFRGIGVAKTFIHMDIRDQPSMWVY